jgi:methyl-accepting chemotaxis protein
MKAFRFKDWNVFSKLLTLTGVIILPFILIFFFKFLPSMEAKLYQDKKDNVQQTVEVAFGIIDRYHKMQTNGNLSKAEAQKQAKAVIQNLRYGENEYFWINTYEPRMVMHPIKPQLNGKELSENKDPNGKYLFLEMVKTAKRQGSGFVDYMWPKPGYDKPVHKISYVKGFDDWDWIVGSGVYVNDVEEEIAALQSSILIFLFIGIAVALLVGFLIAKKISRPVKELDGAASKVADGDVNVQVEVNSKDELGRLSQSFNIMVENIKKAFDEAKQKNEEAEKAAQEAKAAEQKANDQQEYLAKNTKIILTEMDKFADGDLTVHVEPEKEDDDIGKLFKGFNKAVENIKNMIVKVTEAVQATASASSQISSSSEEMAAGAQEQSAQTTEVAGAVEEMTKTISETANNASSANESSKKSAEQVNIGTQNVRTSKESIEKIISSAESTGEIISSLSSKSDQIGEIIQVIDEIADQTNLLALNAAIEAARAGEDGRGFAVVADEVRKLAERTTKATKEIEETIKEIQTEAKDADSSMEDARGSVLEGKNSIDDIETSLNNILSSSDEVQQQINQVAAASEEQSSAAEQISKNIESISSVTQQSAAGVQQIARASEDLNRLTDNLQNLINKFKIGNADSSGSVIENQNKFDYQIEGNGNGHNHFS